MELGNRNFKSKDPHVYREPTPVIGMVVGNII